MNQQIETLYGFVDPQIIDIAKDIRLLICDVDGVFSDGRIYMGNDGEELKTFHTLDGYGIKCLMKAGVEIAVITGRKSNIVANRMQALGVQHLYQGQDDKDLAYQDLCQKLNIAPQHCGYIGDDLIDWPVMKQVGLQVCVANGHPLLKRRANYITTVLGGYGAVREVCDLILQAKDELELHQGLSI
ncbi:3-deoxy-manno-octulosonate-8-phosphatase KdsC [Vibrio profundum]|uniref:3-deoxy-manno-octulosonate-8-phosphatase KdsC n=1 Tax=Vibrio profundum TaxID=2910247 RepID=UPI003D106FF8